MFGFLLFYSIHLAIAIFFLFFIILVALALILLNNAKAWIFSLMLALAAFITVTL